MKTDKIIQWIGFAIFALAFVDNQGWISISFIYSPYDIYMMLGASVIAFFYGTQLKWLGAAIFIFGFAMLQGWVNLNLESVRFSPMWVMLTGYLTLFFNSR